MGRQTVPISCDDIATYGYCAACKISFKTDNISRSKMIQIYDAHCNSKHHLNVIQNVNTEKSSEDFAVQIAALVEKDIKKQEQIDILIKAVKQLSQENMEMKERFIRAEHRYKQLTTDLFGAANKYGRENDSLVAYKSFNERISALEKGIVAAHVSTAPTSAPATIHVEEKNQEEIKYVDESNIEEYNPYEIKKKTKYSPDFEFDDDMIDKINCITNILEAKDEDGIETIEDIEYQFDVFDGWLINIRANSKEILCLDKIKQISDDVKNIALVLEKIREDFYNPKYNAENKGIQKVQKMMLDYVCKIWNIDEFK